MSLHLITPPRRAPLTLQEVKASLRIDTDEDDALIDTHIEAVTSYLDGIDGILGRCLVQQVIELRVSEWDWNCNEIELPLPPYVSTTSVKYLDGTETETTLATDQYTVISGGWAPAILRPAYGVTWPSVACSRPDAIRIRYTAGYAAEDNGGLSGTIPGAIITGMLEMISARYDGCNSCSEGALPMQLQPFVVHSF